MDINKRIDEIENRLFEIRTERENLIGELNKLRKLKSKNAPNAQNFASNTFGKNKIIS